MKKICTLKTMVARGLEQSRDKLAIVEGAKQRTFQQFSERIHKISNALRDLGLQKGDRVVVLSRNSAESAELYFGVTSAGYVVVMLNFRLSLAEILSILSDSRPPVLIASHEYSGQLEPIRKHCPFLRHTICIGEFPANTTCLEYETLVAEASADDPDVDIDEDDTAALIYTSGTTGSPKGCIASHRNLYHVGRSMTLELRMCPNDVGIIPVPMFHASGIVVLLNGVYSGTTTIIMPRWNVLDFMDMVDTYKVTTGFLATPMMEAMVNCLECLPDKLKSLKKVIFAGAPLSAVVFRRAVERFGNIFIHGFGTTETLGSASILHLEHVGEALANGKSSLLGSCGKSYADMQAEVVGNDDVRTPPGVVGEIRARGLGVTQGYWQKEHENRMAFRNGWYYTGDLATVDDDGFIYIVGRKRDIIITGGENVFPAEVENVLHKHPAVAQVAVMGVADEIWGESVAAVIVKKEAANVDEEGIRNFCRQEIAGYKVPKNVIFVNELPTSATGKLLKGKLRKKIGLKALPESLPHD